MSDIAAIYEVLKDVARRGGETAEGLITYKELTRRVGLPLNHEGDVSRISKLLGEISSSEHAQKRPLITAVVVQGEWAGNPQMPGEGFFNLARELGLYAGKTDLDDVEFFAKELQRVYSFWSRQHQEA